MAGKLMTSFFQNPLEAGAFVLQTPLKGAGADMQRIGDVLDRGRRPVSFCCIAPRTRSTKFSSPFSCFSSSSNCGASMRQKLGIAGNERALGIGGAKHDRIARGSADHGTAKVALNGLHMRAGLHELHA